MLFRNKTRHTVRTLGDDALRAGARPVAAIDDDVRQLAARMIETMRAFEGIGLAAPQVGEGVRLVALGVPVESMSENPSPGEIELLGQMPMAIVNPQIVSASAEMTIRDEGCLSVPDIFAPVVRPKTVVVRFQTLDGAPVIVECGGLLGRCIQHEIDHLDGHLFIDRVATEDIGEIIDDLRKLEKYGSKHHYQRVITR
ncbi:MAG: peptide deformylase [Victivallaceae bacterium]